MDELDAGLILVTHLGAVSDTEKAAAAEGIAVFRAGLVADLERSLGWLEGQRAGDAEALAWARWVAQAVRHWDQNFPELASDLDGARERLAAVVAALSTPGESGTELTTAATADPEQPATGDVTAIPGGQRAPGKRRTPPRHGRRSAKQ